MKMHFGGPTFQSHTAGKRFSKPLIPPLGLSESMNKMKHNLTRLKLFYNWGLSGDLFMRFYMDYQLQRQKL